MRIKNFTGPDIPMELVIGIGMEDASLDDLFFLNDAEKQDIIDSLQFNDRGEALETMSTILAGVMLKMGHKQMTIPGRVIEDMKRNLMLLVSVDKRSGDVNLVALRRKEESFDELTGGQSGPSEGTGNETDG